MTETIQLDDFTLSHGNHGSEFCGEACAVEVANLLAAKRIVCAPELLPPACKLEPAPFADDHPSIGRVIRAYVIGLNDAWDDEQRQKLRPYAPRILCTATGDEDEERRAWLATDWLVRVQAPAWLRMIGENDIADALSRAPAVLSAAAARDIQPQLDEARAKASSAWDAAGAAAWDAAGAAAWGAAGDAARDVARAAAWDAARAAARDAAWDAARGALKPTVTELQASALVLLDDMIAVGRQAKAA